MMNFYLQKDELVNQRKSKKKEGHS